MKFISLRNRPLAVLALGLATALPAAAGFVALDSTRTFGNQGWTGALGMDFDVLSPIVITQLGAYDSDANGFSGSIQVGIFNRGTGTLVGTSATLTGISQPLTGYNRFFDIADFALPIGLYSIVAVGFSNSDMNGNTGFYGTGPTIDTGAGLINFVGNARYSFSTSLVLPEIPDGGPVNRYDAGTFQFQAAVPEPQSLALIGLALAALGVTRRRRA